MVTASGSFGGFHSVSESGFAAHMDAFRSKAPTQKAIESTRSFRNFSCAQLAIGKPLKQDHIQISLRKTINHLF
jgi:hypothetical protein